jgi:hypothetical protein
VLHMRVLMWLAALLLNVGAGWSGEDTATVQLGPPNSGSTGQLQTVGLNQDHAALYRLAQQNREVSLVHGDSYDAWFVLDTSSRKVALAVRGADLDADCAKRAVKSWLPKDGRTLQRRLPQLFAALDLAGLSDLARDCPAASGGGDWSSWAPEWAEAALTRLAGLLVLLCGGGLWLESSRCPSCRKVLTLHTTSKLIERPHCGTNRPGREHFTTLCRTPGCMYETSGIRSVRCGAFPSVCVAAAHLQPHAAAPGLIEWSVFQFQPDCVSACSHLLLSNACGWLQR